MHDVTFSLFDGESYNSVFEVGCGSGFFLADAGKDIKVGGIEIEVLGNRDNLVQRFPDQIENFIFRDATKDNWPVADKSYDIVFSIGTLLLIPNPYNTVKEMLRIARKGVFIAEFQDDDGDEFGEEGDVAQDSTPSSFYTRRLHRDYRKVFAKFGLEIESTGHVSGKDIMKCRL